MAQAPNAPAVSMRVHRSAHHRPPPEPSGSGVLWAHGRYLVQGLTASEGRQPATQHWACICSHHVAMGNLIPCCSLLARRRCASASSASDIKAHSLRGPPALGHTANMLIALTTAVLQQHEATEPCIALVTRALWSHGPVWVQPAQLCPACRTASELMDVCAAYRHGTAVNRCSVYVSGKQT